MRVDLPASDMYAATQQAESKYGAENIINVMRDSSYSRLMEQYTAHIRTSNGGQMRTIIMAENQYSADEQAKSMYGAENVLGVMRG